MDMLQSNFYSLVIAAPFQISNLAYAVFSDDFGWIEFIGTVVIEDHKCVRGTIASFLKPKSLKQYLGKMDKQVKKASWILRCIGN